MRPAPVLLVTAALLLLGACTTGTAEPSQTPSAEPSTPSATKEPSATPTAEPPVVLEQPAVWPAADETLATPEEAAAAFVAGTLGIDAELGEFMAGDSRSGEIELQFAGESGGTPITRSLLLVRQLGGDGWFVLAAVNEFASITAPAAGAVVPAGPLEVSGLGRGFEGTVIVEAFRPGQPEPLDTQLAQGGSMADAEPFTVTLDLSAAEPGETIALVVHGGTGHEADPGELGAIPVVIAD